MDGTIYNENEIFDGTLDFLQQIKDHGGRYIFITNNSSKSVNDYVEKVTRMGIQRALRTSIPPARPPPCTSVKIIPDRPYYCMGTRSLVTELRESGLTVVTEPDENAPLSSSVLIRKTPPKKSVIPASCWAVMWCIWLPIRIWCAR